MTIQATGPMGAPCVAGIDDCYADWVAAHDRFTEADATAVRAAIARMGTPPMLSLVVIPGWESQVDLRWTLTALRDQVYPYWELLIPGPPPEAAREILGHDPRLRLLGGGPYASRADAANAALAAASGAFFARLTEADRLAPSALFEVADLIVRHPETELVYADEDRIDAEGARSAPWFKTGWDSDLLLSHYYFGALAVYRSGRLTTLGGYNPRFGGGDVYDMALRAAAALLPGQIRHIPHVLCHRPAHTARSLRDHTCHDDAINGRKVVEEFAGPAVKVEPAPLLPSCHRITFPVPDPAPRVSIIMPTRDRAWLLGPAAWGVLLRTDYPNFELIVVDNASVEAPTLQTLNGLRADPRVRVLQHPGEFNYSAINNAAVAVADGEIVVLLNNDVDVVSTDWLSELVSHAVRPEVGAVGAKLLYGDGTLQHAGVLLGPGLNATHVSRLSHRNAPGYAAQLAVTRSYSAVTGACLAMRRALYQEMGGLDEANFAVAFNDIDLCLRLGDHGYRIVYTPFAELFHLESQSRGTADTPEKQERERREVNHLWTTWRSVFDSDPFHNPNLTTAWHDPLHLCPPRRARAWQRAR